VRSYGRRVVVDMPFDAALIELTRALGYEGISLLTQFDVREFLDATLHHDFRRYVVLEVAMPHVLLEALRDDLGVGPILPTTIAAFELADTRTVVCVADPFAGLMTDSEWRRSAPRLSALADESCRHLAAALTELEHAARVYSVPASSKASV
jgi:uncharacterized protein (DUF302 family)